LLDQIGIEEERRRLGRVVVKRTDVKVIRVAQLIKSGAELRKKEIEVDSYEKNESKEL